MDYRDVLQKHGYMTMFNYFREKYCSNCLLNSTCTYMQQEDCGLFKQWFSEVYYIKQHLNHFDNLGKI